MLNYVDVSQTPPKDVVSTSTATTVSTLDSSKVPINQTDSSSTDATNLSSDALTPSTVNPVSTTSETSSSTNYSSDAVTAENPVSTTLSSSVSSSPSTTTVSPSTSSSSAGSSSSTSTTFSPVSRLSTTSPSPSSGDDQNHVILIIIVVILIIAIIIVLTLIFFLYFRRRNGDDLMKNVENLPLIAMQSRLEEINQQLTREAIPTSDFYGYVQTRHADGDVGFSQEFDYLNRQTLPSNIGGQHCDDPRLTLARYDINWRKNRYPNILAYEASRVVLKLGSKERGTDYINANYIDSYKRSNAYIATQGPLPETVDDFWLMIWQENTHLIIMLAKLQEKLKTKCAQYWPSGEAPSATANFASVSVRLLSHRVSAHYDVRELLLRYKKQERTVYQYHFTCWPDHSVPNSTLILLEFVQKSMARNPPKSGPPVVHCSAGVGRTGCYIVLDSMIKQIDKTKTISIHTFIKSIRQQRIQMVQSESQYIFIHDALLEYILSGGRTSVKAAALPAYVKSLSQPVSPHLYNLAPNNNTTVAAEAEANHVATGTAVNSLQENHAATAAAGESPPDGDEGSSLHQYSNTIAANSISPPQSLLSYQFNLINSVELKDHDRESLYLNASKNRPGALLPASQNIVKIAPANYGKSKADYINASMLHGYHSEREFIITQVPLPETIGDFWKMVWEYNCSLIVCIPASPDDSDCLSLEAGGELATYENIEIPSAEEPGTDEAAALLSEHPRTESDTSEGAARIAAYWAPLHQWRRGSDKEVDDDDDAYHCSDFTVSYGETGTVRTDHDRLDYTTLDLISRVEDYELSSRMYTLRSWPHCFKEPAHVFEAISEIQNMRLNDPKGTVVVVDEYGGTRAGTFCALYMLSEELQQEGSVDVYSTTKIYNSIRPHLFSDQDTLKFIYEAIASRADNYIYENVLPSRMRPNSVTLDRLEHHSSSPTAAHRLRRSMFNSTASAEQNGHHRHPPSPSKSLRQSFSAYKM